MRDFTAVQADDLYELLRERLGRPGKSLIVTSNRQPADWYQLFPNAVVGESILDRLLNSAHHLVMEGKSFRPNRRPGRRTSTTKERP
jgi:DNA replication protein DnaC